jgi:hypothetical protein
MEKIKATIPVESIPDEILYDEVRLKAYLFNKVLEVDPYLQTMIPFGLKYYESVEGDFVVECKFRD